MVEGRYLFPLLLVLVVIAGCASNAPVNTTPAMAPTTAPLPDPTFSTPHYVSPAMHVSATVTGAAVQYASDTNDPIVGDWRLVNAPFPCDAVFGDSGDGHATCAVFQHSAFTWIKNNDTEYSLSDNAGHVVLTEMQSDNVTMSSSAFPNGSFLQKVGY
jgi:hypothetical protein